jgi:hypothetical protein
VTMAHVFVLVNASAVTTTWAMHAKWHQSFHAILLAALKDNAGTIRASASTRASGRDPLAICLYARNSVVLTNSACHLGSVGACLDTLAGSARFLRPIALRVVADMESA